MSAQVEVLEHYMAKITITVPAERFDKAITAAYKKMKNQISVPGFRKGKVPQNLVEKMYGPSIFYEEACNSLVPEVYNEESAQITEIEITSQPEIEIVQIGKGQEFIFTATVATKPEAQIGQYKEIEVAVEPVVVTDEDVAEEIKSVQEKNAREMSVDGPAKSGDTVVLDYTGTVDGELFDGGTAENYSLELGSGSFIPGFEDQLIGAMKDQDIDVNVTFPEEYHAEELAGKPALFKCKIHEIKTKELPELDDEFAQDVSECETLEEYKAQIKADLETKKKEAARSEKQQAVMDKIIEDAEFDIPDPMVATQAKQMFDRQMREFAQYGISAEQYCQYTGQTMDQVAEQFKEPALKNIQSRLVLEAVAKAEGIEAGEDDITAELEKMAAQYGMEVDKLRENMDEYMHKMLIGDIQAQKALDFVTDAAVEVVPEAVEATVEE